MEILCVGGAVRDELLGRPVSDRDWVVVGATPEQMESRGFRPVGRDFPVFLHPQTHEEYALARTERKVSPGYRGFVVHSSPDVTLEDDLRRRDLTINAMARAADGTLIDPWGGLSDLRAKRLRHVSDAFAEDPVRILRLARFAARFADFTVAPETVALARGMVNAGEADALVAERIWQEVSRGLMESTPSRMLAVLDQCGALARILPALGDTESPAQRDWQSTLNRLDLAARNGASLAVRYALLTGWPREPRVALDCSARMRAPSDCAELARLVADHGGAKPLAATASELASLMEGIDALRRPDRAIEFVRVCAYRDGADPLTQAATAQALVTALRAVDAGAIASAAREQSPDARESAHRIREALRRAREEAIAAYLRTPASSDHTDP